jgi:bifunctional DNA-binding transcriptional regulator/antitoxin component of YhaV-PrlF toxin-antitoxin module
MQNQMLVQLQPRGYLTIPIAFRRDWNLTDGLVRITKNESQLIIEPVRVLPYPVRSYTPAEVKEFLAEDAQETQQLKTQGFV